MRYAVVIEKAANNYSAYVPDLPGCIATGNSVQQTLNNLRAAMQLHIEGLQKDGQSLPDPSSLVDYIELDWAALISAQARESRLNRVG